MIPPILLQALPDGTMTARIPLYLLLLAATVLVVVFLFMAAKWRRENTLLHQVISVFNTPVLFYDPSGKLAYINNQAEDVFSEIRPQIDQYSFIEDNANPDGPEYYLSDAFGNGYRLEITRRTIPGGEGRAVIVKGYAKVKGR